MASTKDKGSKSSGKDPGDLAKAAKGTSAGAEDVESMLGKSVHWVGRHPNEKYASRYGDAYEAWYSRGIEGAGSGEHMKILLGG